VQTSTRSSGLLPRRSRSTPEGHARLTGGGAEERKRPVSLGRRSHAAADFSRRDERMQLSGVRGRSALAKSRNPTMACGEPGCRWGLTAWELRLHAGHVIDIDRRAENALRSGPAHVRALKAEDYLMRPRFLRFPVNGNAECPEPQLPIPRPLSFQHFLRDFVLRLSSSGRIKRWVLAKLGCGLGSSWLHETN
jgi:hypothetical protein